MENKNKLFEPQYWEYMVGGMEGCSPEEEQSHLNKLGKDGYELVALVRIGNTTHFYLKRPLKLA